MTNNILHTGEDLWKLPDSTEHLSNQAICTAESGVDHGTNANQSTWDGKLKVIALGMQRDDSAKDGFALVPTLRVFCNDTGSNLNFLTEPQNTGKDRATSNTTFQVVNLGTGFVDVE